jgi:hypothetical protein
MEGVQSPGRLFGFGVRVQEPPAVVKRSVGRSPAWNPGPFNKEGMLQICRAVV